MTGYQEIMSDPSYAGQIVTMTYTQIGNTGINPEDMESKQPWIRGFVVKESARRLSNWRAQEDLDTFLKRHKIPAIEGIDTRKLVAHLREHGSMRGVISHVEFDTDTLVHKAKAWPGLAGMDLTGDVTCDSSYVWKQGRWKLESGYHDIDPGGERKKVVVIDYGVKRNILRSLVQAGCDLTVLPASATAEEVLARSPDGVFLSNGPGDPDAVKHAIRAIAELVESGKPLFGICLGHQMLSLALGAQTEKMKFGHRGGNHPVQNLANGSVEVTSQNHGFMVREESLPEAIEVTHRSLFDGTIEGIRHKHAPVFSVQHHPEASPGPHDAHYLFKQFVDLMRG
ncbi:putative carbamoyl-phosphate synthase small subunit [Magnetofaba australis IT-1]|uniref:Carbamoyl phosphate synthase small chain n=2 Tax=Magnetofaba TaxID=1472292 RepID=A0A1Y2K228_9PROT|nr:putative carbamoyl-phosphate synthase small subunit [Magnetofaba australis IT-1]